MGYGSQKIVTKDWGIQLTSMLWIYPKINRSVSSQKYLYNTIRLPRSQEWSCHEMNELKTISKYH